MLTPWWMLSLVSLLLLVVLVADRQISRRRARRLRRLAEHCGFRYSSVDRFDLARRVRDSLPPTAADVVVRDLMYRAANGGGYVYAFTVLYGGPSRGRVVLLAREACGDCNLRDIHHGDEGLYLGEQYRRLLHEVVPQQA